MKNASQRNKRRKRKGLKSKQKTTPKSAEHTMGSPKRRKHKTMDLNPSPVARTKSCKEMGEKPGRTPSLDDLDRL
jgi:hypothetical protein